MEIVISARTTVQSIKVEVHARQGNGHSTKKVQPLVNVQLDSPTVRHMDRVMDVLFQVLSAVEQWLCEDCPDFPDDFGDVDLV